ncbi:MAG: ABC transporter substrate-binding protein [Alphaproteobacteria bacterium]|nr:ABC transporter substrate-binding protein [Alphaproteobacteria bacterium]
MRAFFRFVPALFLIASVAAARADDGGTVLHGLSLFGAFKYGPEFTHFDYVDPDAPKGGTVTLAAIGTYDTLNPFTLRGIAADGAGGIFDTLMIGAADEVSVQYGLVAQSVERAPDNSWVLFHLRPEARFHDGSPMTPEDVVWTFETLKTKGHPSFRITLADVVKAEVVGAHEVKFTFANGDNREAPLYVGQLPVLSRKYWEGRDFEKTTVEPPLGSGPYRIESVEPGRSITYARVKDYWAQNLPVRRGTGNFDTLRYDYYRDTSVALEAFKAGQYDFRQEFTAKDWATGYDSPALRQKLILKDEIHHQLTEGMQGFVFNTRKPLFQDPRVRQALGYAFDFEWINKNLMYGAYQRTKSWFSNSVFAATGLPGAAERAILEKYRGRIPEAVFTTPYEPPTTDGSGNLHDNLREALRLLKQAGWSFKGDQLVNDKTGEPFTFEILYPEERLQRIMIPFSQNLARLGIRTQLRLVDPAQYQNRVRDFDYDFIMNRWGGSFPPGNELRDLFTGEAAKTPGSSNFMGAADPVLDALVEETVSAKTLDEVTNAAHALDRVALYGYYVIPHYYSGTFRVAYWDKFGRPKVAPKYALGFDAWWVDPAREAQMAQQKQGIKAQ